MAISATKKADSAFEGLSIKWDRTIIFLLGCAALFLAIITGILAPLTVAVTWPWPVFLGLLGSGSIGALRYLAIQERREHAVYSTASTATGGVAEHAPTGHTPVFNNEEYVAQEAALRAQQQRAALDLPDDQTFLDGMNFADESENAQHSVPTHAELIAVAKKVAEESARATGSTWDPVPVPKPTYARTAVAHRPAPQALEVPEVPVADRTQSLHDAAKAPEPAAEEHPHQAGINLDDVLNRRRA